MFIVLSEETSKPKVCFTRVISHIGRVRFIEYAFRGVDCKSGEIVGIKSMKNAYFVTVYDCLPMGNFVFQRSGCKDD